MECYKTKMNPKEKNEVRRQNENSIKQYINLQKAIKVQTWDWKYILFDKHNVHVSVTANQYSQADLVEIHFTL